MSENLIGWLLPSGEWLPCSYEEHSQAADKWFDEHKPGLNTEEESGWHFANAQGWLEIEKGFCYFEWIPGEEEGLTKAQLDWLEEHVLELASTSQDLLLAETERRR